MCVRARVCVYLFGIWHPGYMSPLFFCLAGVGWKDTFRLGSAGFWQTKINQIMSCVNNGDGKAEGREGAGMKTGNT